MLNTRRFGTYSYVIAFVILFAGHVVASQQSAGELFEKALYMEEAQGDLQTAIDLYKRIINQFPESRDIAAKAQFHIGLCYEKLGFQEAPKAFQKVVDDFPDQVETVKKAREKLSVLQKAGALIAAGALEHGASKLYESSERSFGFLSPNGKHIALLGEGDIWLRDISSGEEVRLTRTPNYKFYCFWSPDSTQIAYLDVSYGLYVIPAKGGEPKTLIAPDSDFVKEGQYAQPTGWTSDSRNVVCLVSNRGLCALPLSGGKWKDIFPFTERYPAEKARWMVLSPDGKFVALAEEGDIYVIPVGGGAPIQITGHPASDSGPVWSLDGKWLTFLSSRGGESEVWVTRISPDGNSAGQPFPVFRGMALERNSFFQWTEDGKIGFSISRNAANIFVRDVETGEETQLTHSFLEERHPRWSPDGTYLAFVTAQRRDWDLWVSSSEGGEAVRITNQVPHPESHSYITRASWFPDGKRLAFGGFFGEETGLWTVPAAGGKVLKMNFDFDPGFECCDISPDGTILAFDYSRGKDGNYIEDSRASGKDIFILAVAGGKPRRITKIDKEGLSFQRPRWSPDGEKIAFISQDWIEREQGRPSQIIWICDFPAGEPRAATKSMPGLFQHLSWSPDGKTILFSSYADYNQPELLSLSIESGEIKKWGIAGSSPDFSPDGTKIAFTRDKEGTMEFWLVENFLPPEKK